MSNTLKPDFLDPNITNSMWKRCFGFHVIRLPDDLYCLYWFLWSSEINKVLNVILWGGVILFYCIRIIAFSLTITTNEQPKQMQVLIFLQKKKKQQQKNSSNVENYELELWQKVTFTHWCYNYYYLTNY